MAAEGGGGWLTGAKGEDGGGCLVGRGQRTAGGELGADGKGCRREGREGICGGGGGGGVGGGRAAKQEEGRGLQSATALDAGADARAQQCRCCAGDHVDDGEFGGFPSSSFFQSSSFFSSSSPSASCVVCEREKGPRVNASGLLHLV